MNELKKGTKFQIIDPKHKDYMEPFVIMFKQFENKYGYGDNVNDKYAKGTIKTNQIKVIEGL